MCCLKFPSVEPTEFDAKFKEAVKNFEKAVIQFNLGEDDEKIGRSYYKLGCCFLAQVRRENYNRNYGVSTKEKAKLCILESTKYFKEGADYLEPHIRLKIDKIGFFIHGIGAWLAHLEPFNIVNHEFMKILVKCEISSLD